MKINTMPKGVACELLAYIAENENFKAVLESLGDDISADEIKSLLREISFELQKELSAETGEQYDVKKCPHLSKNTKKIISYLSSHEENALLKAFGLVENK